MEISQLIGNRYGCSFGDSLGDCDFPVIGQDVAIVVGLALLAFGIKHYYNRPTPLPKKLDAQQICFLKYPDMDQERKEVISGYVQQKLGLYPNSSKQDATNQVRADMEALWSAVLEAKTLSGSESGPLVEGKLAEVVKKWADQSSGGKTTEPTMWRWYKSFEGIANFHNMSGLDSDIVTKVRELFSLESYQKLYPLTVYNEMQLQEDGSYKGVDLPSPIFDFTPNKG